MATFRPSAVNATLVSDSVESVLPGMLVSSLGRVDSLTENIRVSITRHINDTSLIGVIQSVTPSTDTGEHHDVTLCPIRGLSMDAVPIPNIDEDASDSTIRFQYTPVWVLYDPTGSVDGLMGRVYAGSLLTSSPIPGFAMVQNSASETAESGNIYHSYTIGRSIVSCFPYTNLRDCLEKGELHIQPDYLQFKVQRDIAGEPMIYDIYGHFSENAYVGKTLKAALIPAIIG